MSTLTSETRALVKEARDLAMRERLPRASGGHVGFTLAERCYTATGGDGHAALLLALDYLRLIKTR